MIGSRPPGSCSPSSTSARASPISWPGNQICRTAGTSSSHGIVTGDPVLSTTTVRGLAPTTVAHQVVLVAGQGQRRPVLALGLPVVVGADDHDRHVGAGGQRRRPLEVVALRHGPGADDEPAHEVGFSERVIDGHLVRAVLQLDRAAHLGAADAEEGAAALRLGQLDDGLAVQRHPGGADGAQSDLPLAGVLGLERPGDPRAEPRRAHAGGRRLVPVPGQAADVGRARGPRLVLEGDGEVPAHRRQVLGDRPAGLERDVREPLGQRLQRAPAVVRLDPRAAPTLDAPEAGVRADQCDARHGGGQRQGGVVVLQQHHRPSRRRTDHFAGLGVVGGLLGRVGVGGAGPLGQAPAGGRRRRRGRAR